MPVSDPADSRSGAAAPALEAAWAALLGARRRARRADAPKEGASFAADADAGLRPVAETSPEAILRWHAAAGWSAAQVPPAWQALIDLYLPVCNARARSPLTIGHLGQGLEGFIATRSGDSDYVTGPENLLHLHRLRALCDAVLVGAGTVATDDPRLTVRRAAGPNPVRVILDPRRRLAATHAVIADGAAPTLLVCDAARAGPPGERFGQAEVLGIPMADSGLELETLLAALHARGLFAVFVEGGGKTVSAFLERGLLDRLQIAVAPLITGSGTPGLRVAARQRIADCLRVPPRVFTMGDDVLFDCDLRQAREPITAAQPASETLRRIL